MEAFDVAELPHVKRCIAVSEEAVASGNHPFGALLVHDGAVIAEAENTVVTERDPTGHAETNLVRKVGPLLTHDELQRSTLYTSTEPCAMCSSAIYWSGIGRVVYACGEDALYDIVGPDGPALRLPCREVFAKAKTPVAVVGPVEQDAACAIHRAFW